MTERPTERDLELDAIDDDFKKAVGGFTTILHTYGIAPVETFEKAHAMASQGLVKARRARLAMIALLDALAVLMLLVGPVYAGSMHAKLHRHHHDPRWCVRNWWYDAPEKYWILCKDK